MKSLHKLATILVLALFLLWSTGCSASGAAAQADPKEETHEAKPAGWARTALLAGGAALVIGGLFYVIPRISAASKFSNESPENIGNTHIVEIK